MEHVDVVIVGAGLSGIGSAVHLTKSCPAKSFVLLEAREAIGGTWDLFRYPGVRSDSDMHTLGYVFKPWREARAIADGPAILAYVNEAAREHGIDRHIRFGHKATTARWSSETARWTVETETPAGIRTFTCSMLLMCGGYYSYAKGHTPDFPGLERFGGRVVHPQFWPGDLDHKGRRVAVIGSGATAVTLVPAMARTAAHVTMVQRSPTWIVAWPAQDAIANRLRRWLPEKLAYAITRWKNTRNDVTFYRRTRTEPGKVREELLQGVRDALGPDHDVATHFTPRYAPWDQRLCLVPDGDLFRALRKGRASVATGTIRSFTEQGLELESGETVAADIVVMATGLELEVMGGMSFSVDGQPVRFPETWSYKGMMFSGVPNLVQTFGYINASWTLRADLTAEFACRLINRMDELGLRQATPRLRASDAGMPERPWIDDFSAGYVQRALHLFPRQGDRDPWRHTQDFAEDKRLIRYAPIEDGALQLDNPAPAAGRDGAHAPALAAAR